MPRLLPRDPVIVRTPSTIGNFGPGFDATSLALAWGGDTLTARSSDEDRITLAGPGSDRIPTAWRENCAAAAFGFLRQRHDVEDPIHLHIEKGVPPGSGLGSSASSSAAGALAFAARHREIEWDVHALVEAATFGESQVAGAHGDDVAAAIQGGLSIVGQGKVGRVQPPAGLFLAIARPDLTLETKTMRAAVPAMVPVAAAVTNMANVAFVIDALHQGDIAAIQHALGDGIATPGRRTHLPFFDVAERAARDAGAAGIAIAGSGPSLFTVAQDLSAARDLASAMAEAIGATGIEAEPIACEPERRRVWEEALRA